MNKKNPNKRNTKVKKMPAKKPTKTSTKTKMKKKNNKSLFSFLRIKSSGANKILAAIVVVGLSVLGVHFILASHAATGQLTVNFPPIAIADSGSNTGYWMAASDGGVFAQGTATFHGSMGSSSLSAPIVGMAPTTDNGGYYLVGADGAVYAFGDAKYAGGVNTIPHNAPIVGIAAHNGGGYWVMDSLGETYAFGGAPSFGYNPSGYSGSMVAIAADGAGTGYFAVSSYGQDYALGGAGGCGNAGVTNIVGVTAGTSGASGCWMVGSDGGVFAYGGANFYSSMAGQHLNAPIVGIAHTSDYKGYWLVASDGGVFAFGDAQFAGRVVYNPPTSNITTDFPDIIAGQKSHINWGTTNAQSVSITNVGSVAANGSMWVSPTVTTTYVLSAVGSGGSSSSSVTIHVKQPPPSAVASGGSSGSSSGGSTGGGSIGGKPGGGGSSSTTSNGTPFYPTKSGCAPGQTGKYPNCYWTSATDTVQLPTPTRSTTKAASSYSSGATLINLGPGYSTTPCSSDLRSLGAC